MRSTGCTLKVLENTKAKELDTRGENRFLFLVFVVIYFISIALSFARIYIFEDYPIYYSEEEIPALPDQFSMILEKILP